MRCEIIDEPSQNGKGKVIIRAEFEGGDWRILSRIGYTAYDHDYALLCARLMKESVERDEILEDVDMPPKFKSW